MCCWSNFNHDKSKKKATEEEVDVSILLSDLVYRSCHLMLEQVEIYFRVNFNRFDVLIRNSVGAVSRQSPPVTYPAEAACGSGSFAAF